MDGGAREADRRLDQLLAGLLLRDGVPVRAQRFPATPQPQELRLLRSRLPTPGRNPRRRRSLNQAAGASSRGVSLRHHAGGKNGEHGQATHPESHHRTRPLRLVVETEERWPQDFDLQNMSTLSTKLPFLFNLCENKSFIPHNLCVIPRVEGALVLWGHDMTVAADINTL